MVTFFGKIYVSPFAEFVISFTQVAVAYSCAIVVVVTVVVWGKQYFTLRHIYGFNSLRPSDTYMRH